MQSHSGNRSRYGFPRVILSLEAQFTTAEMIAGIFSCSSNCYQHNHNHNGTHNHNNNNNNNNDQQERLASAQVGEARFLV